MINALNGGANLVDHPGSKNGNIGHQMGKYISGKISPAVDYLGNRIKPGVDDFANLVSNYQKSLGTEQERSTQWLQIIAKQQERLIQIQMEALKDGKQLPGALNRAVGGVLQSYAQAEERAILGGF